MTFSNFLMMAQVAWEAVPDGSVAMYTSRRV
jgi:hypothetical protein